jgi:hypothetical protein
MMSSADESSETDDITSICAGGGSAYGHDKPSSRDSRWLIPSPSSIFPALVQTGRSLTGRLQTWLSSQLSATDEGRVLFAFWILTFKIFNLQLIGPMFYCLKIELTQYEH